MRTVLFRAITQRQYPLYRRLDGLISRPGWVKKIGLHWGTPERPAPSESLYGLSYPGHHTADWREIKNKS